MTLGRRHSLPAALALVCALACCTAAAASAAVPPLFWQQPEDGVAGGEAGRFQAPIDIAADPDSGHLFVADAVNARIVELTAWGEFVKTWGWGVVASGPGDQPPENEIQELTVAASAGAYRLLYRNVYGEGLERKQETVPIGFDWPAADPGTPGAVDSVEEALDALPTFAASPGSVKVSGGPGGPGGASPYVIELVGPYADRDVPPLLVLESTLTGEASVQSTQEGGSFEVCVPADGDVCQAGQAGGAKPGEMQAPGSGLVLDESGDIYVYDALTDANLGGPNLRVQKFSPDGKFLLMWGGEVNKTKSAEGGSTEAERNLCTKAQVEAGDVCGAGVPGTGDGQFAINYFGLIGNRLAVGPSGSIFVGDNERIQRFSQSGAFEGEVKLPGEDLAALEVDGEGDLYASFRDPSIAGGPPKANVRKLEVEGEEATEVMTFPAAHPRKLALDGSGNLYIIDFESAESGKRSKVIAYEADGTPLIGPEEHFAETETNFGLGGVGTSEACGIPGVNVYVSDLTSDSVSAYGPAPQDTETCPPPANPPQITAQSAIEVGTESAKLRARINPRFWKDTRYFVEYGTSPCAAGGCPSDRPTPPGLLLTEEVTQKQIQTQGVLVTGLQPNTTYRYRFVAESSGGGPVYGIDPDGEGEEEASFEAGLEGTFTTRPVPATRPPCPNDAYRYGPGARLPDCRAYEMVSPVDKEGGDIIVLNRPGSARSPMTINQSAPSGERLSYSSYRAFGDAVSAPISSAYLASRTAAGWGTEAISPPRGTNLWEVANSLDSQFKAFSTDLCQAWLVNETDLTLTPGAPEGFANVYRRQNCGAGAGSYQDLIPVAPDSIEAKDFKPEAQGASADGLTAIFRVRDKLEGVEEAIACETPGDVGTCKLQLYEATPEGAVRAVCLLPVGEGGEAAPAGCSAGSATGIDEDGRNHMVKNAISADGLRIYWSDKPNGPGRIFLREDGSETLPVSEEGEALSGKAGAGAQYWSAADDGSAAVFTVGSPSGGQADLYRYLADGAETEAVAGQVYGLLGASEDASRIYLVSGEALDEGASEGEPNLYLFEAGEGGGSFSFVATLSEPDATAGTSVSLSPVNVVPKNHTAQVSPDGSHVAFMSSAQLTGADNADASSGEPDAQVFLYDAGAGELRCVSCDPTGALPVGRNVGGEGNSTYWAAAQIPVTQTQIYQTPSVLAADGSRLYFEAFGPLVGEDTNGKADVYQWEATGEGGCLASSPSHVAAAGGCVDLISSGRDKADSAIVAVSGGGRDVFFATEQSLLAQDPDLVDVYDARELGGFPAPTPPPAECEGSACQSPPPAPPAPTPGSATFQGPGNLAPPAPDRCAPRARRAKRLTRRAKAQRRAARRAGRSGNRRARNRSLRIASRSAAKARRLSRGAKRCRARLGRSARAKSGR